MLRSASLFLHLFLLLAAYLAVARDVCSTEGTSEAARGVSADHFHEVSDAGSQFLQVSKLATYGKKETVSLQPSANSTQDPLTKVTPLKCDANFNPLQMIKTETGFAVKSLDLETGKYLPKYDYPWDLTDPPFADINACDVNPYDDIIYCVLRSDGKSYIVRLDEKRIEFVVELPASIWSSGAFGYTGEFFISMHGAELLIVPPIHELPSYGDDKRWKVENYRYLKPGTPEGFWHTADSVVVNRNFSGGQGEEYFLSVYGPKLQMAAIEKGKVVKTWIKHVEPARWDNVYGAGWNFDGDVFFSINGGGGVWQVPLDDIDLNDPDQIVKMVQVGLSEPTDYNDGLDCHDVPNPWGEKPAPSEAPVEAAAAEPEEVPAAVTEAPTPEAPAPVIEMAPTPAPVVATTEAPVIVAEAAPPPMNWGPVGVFMLLVIPLFLCCMRHLQTDRQELFPPPFMLPFKPRPPPAPPMVPIARPPVMLPPSPPRSNPTVIAAPKPVVTAPPPAPAPVMTAPAVVVAAPAPVMAAPAAVTIQAKPVLPIAPRVTEIDKVTASGQVVERDFIIGGAAQVVAAPAVTEIDKVTASGQVVERDFIIQGAPQVVSSPAATEIDRVNAAGQVFERDFFIGGAAPVVAAPAVTEIDRVNASGQVFERDFIVQGAAPVASLPAQVIAAPVMTEIDRVNASGQVVERDISFGSRPTALGSPTVSEIDRVNASGQVVERDFIIVGDVQRMTSATFSSSQ